MVNRSTQNFSGVGQTRIVSPYSEVAGSRDFNHRQYWARARSRRKGRLSGLEESLRAPVKDGRLGLSPRPISRHEGDARISCPLAEFKGARHACRSMHEKPLLGMSARAFPSSAWPAHASAQAAPVPQICRRRRSRARAGAEGWRIPVDKGNGRAHAVRSRHCAQRKWSSATRRADAFAASRPQA